jgi:hypothetical protein
MSVGSGLAAAGAATETMETSRQNRPSTTAVLEVRLTLPKPARRFIPPELIAIMYLFVAKYIEYPNYSYQIFRFCGVTNSGCP